MNIRNYKIFLFAVIFISAHLISFPGISFSDEVPQIAIVVSKRIKPYVSIIEGMTEELGKKEKKFEIFFLPESDPPDHQQITTQLENTGFALYAAVGPEAAKLVWSLKTDRSKVFTAVLDPEALLETGSSQCGVSLRIPVERQSPDYRSAGPKLAEFGLCLDDPGPDGYF